MSARPGTGTAGSVAAEVWTDGGCQGNPGPGGWAFVMRHGATVVERSGFNPATTNNRMELTAVREALRHLAGLGGDGAPPPAVVTTDSQYVQKGVTQWIHAWVRNGWKTSAKKPVLNAELWREILELSRGLDLRWEWVLGHAGNAMNERCDALVQEAMAAGRKRRA